MDGIARPSGVPVVGRPSPVATPRPVTSSWPSVARRFGLDGDFESLSAHDERLRPTVAVAGRPGREDAAVGRRPHL
jgi:hypothetical protein